MLNPIRNIERHPGPGGSERISIKLPKTADPLRRKPHNYPVKRASPRGAVFAIKMQDGGDVDEPEATDPATPDIDDLREPDADLSPSDQEQKEIVVEAMAALRGQHPDPEKAIQRFIEAFGEDEFQELEQMMAGEESPGDDESGGGDDFGLAPPAGPPPAAGPPTGMQVGGLLHGPGSGQDDQIEAQTPSGRRVLLSDGEYVVDAPTVAALGDGSTDAGARRLDRFRKEVRRQSYGHENQAKRLSGGGRAAMLEALNR